MYIYIYVYIYIYTCIYRFYGQPFKLMKGRSAIIYHGILLYNLSALGLQQPPQDLMYDSRQETARRIQRTSLIGAYVANGHCVLTWTRSSRL